MCVSIISIALAGSPAHTNASAKCKFPKLGLSAVALWNSAMDDLLAASAFLASVPHGHWKTLTLIAALRIDGLTAPYVVDGAMDGPSFLAYVEQVLVPTLRKGDIVFM